MRTLDDIIPPSRRRESEPMSDSGSDNHRPKNSGESRFPFTTFIAIVLVIITSIGVLFYFSTSKVEVTPSTVSVAVQSSFTATQGTGSLPFQVITAQKTASQTIKSSGSKQVSSSASGMITVYNIQAKSQKLIANTRFATTAGLVFRIHTAVTVPAGTTQKPGSVVVKVYADKPGSTYNVGPTSFTVPGFAGTPQANQIYARSIAPITGGVSGNVPIADVTEEQQARKEISAALSSDLLASVQAQIPTGFVLVSGAATTTFEAIPLTPSSTTGMADVKELGTVTAVVFPNAALASAIASSVTSIGYQGESISLKSTDKLEYTPENGVPNTETQSISFTLSGTAPLIYSIDRARIAAAIAGKSRSAAEVALTNYPEVKKALIILRPFWRQTFPEDPTAISVVTVEEAY